LKIAAGRPAGPFLKRAAKFTGLLGNPFFHCMFLGAVMRPGAPRRAKLVDEVPPGVSFPGVAKG